MSTLGTDNDSLEKEPLTPTNEVEKEETSMNETDSATTEQAETTEEAVDKNEPLEAEITSEKEEPIEVPTEEPTCDVCAEVELPAEATAEVADAEEVTEECVETESPAEEIAEVVENVETDNTEAPTPVEKETTNEDDFDFNENISFDPNSTIQVIGEAEEPIKDEDNSEVVEEEQEENSLIHLSKEELVKKLKEVLTLSTPIKNEIDAIKQAFYKKHKAEQSEELKKHLEAGGIKEEFEQKVDALEEELKEIIAEYRNIKAEQTQKIQQEKESNLAVKEKILEQFKALTDDLDSIENVNEAINKVRALQQEWKNTGAVPQEQSNDLWKNYQLYNEKFYDYVKINNELREYDLKKNLELKTAICEQAEKLSEISDVQTAFRILQALHDEWKEIGPVVRELREEIWERLKAASSVVNKKHQDYFEAKKQEEEKNLAEKTALCEQIESTDYTLLKNYKDWEEKTKEIIEIQGLWKRIGFAPKKANIKVYERFRKACDDFFQQKNEFFQRAKNELNENLEKKIKLCEQAEALQDSTEWKETSDKMIKLQKEWKAIGAVPRKQSDIVWKRFLAACDHFFEQKNKSTSGERQEQEKNLEQKKAIVAKIEALDIENPKEAFQQLKNLIGEWNNIGFVPFKEKDKIYKTFKKATDEMFDKLKVDEQNRRLHTFKTSIEELSSGKSSHSLFRERDKLKKDLEFLSNEISTYENNIGFFSSSSKKADKLIKDMEKKIENLKDERNLLLKKIEVIESNLEN